MQQFHFGQRIRCADGEAGLLTQMVFDPASRRMTAPGVMLGRVSVSFATVVSVTEERSTRETERTALAALRKEAPAGAVLDSKSMVETDHTSVTAATGTRRRGVDPILGGT